MLIWALPNIQLTSHIQTHETITKIYLTNRGPDIIGANGIPIPDPELYMAETFVKECNEMYKQTWLSKIEDLLRYSGEKNHEAIIKNYPGKKKRFIIARIIAGYCITNFLKTIYDNLVPWSEYHKMERIEELEERERKQLEKFQLELNVTNVVQQGLLDMIKSNMKSIREQNRRFNHLAMLSAEVTWLASYVQTRMMFSSVDLKTVIDEKIHHKVATVDMSELLNMTDFKEIENIDTEFISASRITKQTIRLKFNIRTKAEDTFVYKIHDFRYWKNLTETPTLMEYQGERFIVYNKTANCIKGIEEPTQRAVTDYCDTANYTDPAVTVWRKLVTVDNIYSHQNITTLKRTLLYNYIYCFPSEIRISDGNHKCPPAVFRVPINVGWSTRDKNYVPIIRKVKFVERELPFIDDVHLTHFDDDSLAANDASMFDKLQELRKTTRTTI